VTTSDVDSAADRSSPDPSASLLDAPADASRATVFIVRDGRESSRKCSLTPVRGRAGVEFRTWVRERPIDVGTRTLLHPDGPPLSSADRGRPLLLVDCAWRHLPQVLRDVRGELIPRSIPAGFATAYPRRSRLFADPSSGLASVEALFVALHVLGVPRPDLLEGYRFADAFLERNRERLL